MLGGVELEHDRGLDGHSDADVLTHAIIDAMLGACALGDIGEHFPGHRLRDTGTPTRSSCCGRRWRCCASAGFAVRHVDATVVLERPKLAPARERMRARLAEALGLDVRHVSVKATRGEGMGFVGREEGIAALAVATVDEAGLTAGAAHGAGSEPAHRK